MMVCESHSVITLVLLQTAMTTDDNDGRSEVEWISVATMSVRLSKTIDHWLECNHVVHTHTSTTIQCIVATGQIGM